MALEPPGRRVSIAVEHVHKPGEFGAGSQEQIIERVGRLRGKEVRERYLSGRDQVAEQRPEVGAQVKPVDKLRARGEDATDLVARPLEVVQGIEHAQGDYAMEGCVGKRERVDARLQTYGVGMTALELVQERGRGFGVGQSRSN